MSVEGRADGCGRSLVFGLHNEGSIAHLGGRVMEIPRLGSGYSNIFSGHENEALEVTWRFVPGGLATMG